MRSGSAKASGFSRTAFTTLNIAVFADPDRIVTLSSLWKRSAGHGQVSAPDYHDWHDQSTAFEEMAYYQDDDLSVTAGPVAEYAHVAQVTPEFFRVFQVEPTVGHEFSSDETKQGSSGAAIISSAYSANHFGGISQALGHSLRLGGRTFDIVGVMPPGFRFPVGFRFPAKTDIWFPADTIYPETESRSAHNYLVVGRLKSSVSLEQAQAQMTTIGLRLEEKFPDSNKGKNVAVTCLRESGEHAARKVRGSHPRDRDSRRSWRDAQPHRAPTDHRKHSDGSARRSSRRAPRHLGSPRARGAGSRRCAATGRNRNRWPRTGVRLRSLPAGRSAVWPRACSPGFAN